MRINLRFKLPPFELHRPKLGHLTTLPALDTPKLQHCRHENQLRLKLPPFELHRPWFGHLTTLLALDMPKLQHCFHKRPSPRKRPVQVLLKMIEYGGRSYSRSAVVGS